MKNAEYKIIIFVLTIVSVGLIQQCSKVDQAAERFSPQSSEVTIKPGDKVTFNVDKKNKSYSYSWGYSQMSLKKVFIARESNLSHESTYTHEFKTEGIYEIQLHGTQKNNSNGFTTNHSYTVQPLAAGTTSTGALSTLCCVGTWTKIACGIIQTKVITAITQNSGTSTVDDTDCGGTIARHVAWNWTESAGVITWEYTAYTIGSTTPALPPKEVTPYTCSGNTFSSGGETWSRSK